MIKKIKKNQENKFVINAILPLKTFSKFEKTLRFDRNPLHNHREIFMKISKFKNLSKRFCVREKLYVLREKSGTRPECP